MKLIETGSSWTGGGMSAKFTNNPGTGGGTCFGDSGGPIFYKDTNVGRGRVLGHDALHRRGLQLPHRRSGDAGLRRTVPLSSSLG
jgi:hypothetical protein